MARPRKMISLEEQKKELLKAVENSTKTYEEIMAFICSEDEIN